MKRLQSLVVTTAALAFLIAPAWAGDHHADAPQSKASCTLRVDLSIGGPDADDPAQFYEKMGSVKVGVDGSGNVYVLDDGNCRVQVFGPDGSFLRTVGGQGGGPGEFKFPAHMAVNGDGTLAVFDMGQQRVSIFDGTGKLVRDQVVGGMVTGLVVAPDGGLVLAYEPQGGVEAEAFDPAGKSLWVAGKATQEQEMMMKIKGQSSVTGNVALAADGGVFVVTEGNYSIRHFAEGSVAGTWSREFDRQKFEMPQMNSDDEDGGPRMMMITVEDDGESGGADVSVESGSHEEMTFDMEQLKNMMPEFHDDLRGVVRWPNGTLWAFTSATEGDHVVVDEWSASGDYLRRLTLPEYDWYQVGADGNLYGVDHDEDDYPIVHRFTVETAS